jgi:hypothetical protein
MIDVHTMVIICPCSPSCTKFLLSFCCQEMRSLFKDSLQGESMYHKSMLEKEQESGCSVIWVRVVGILVYLFDLSSASIWWSERGVGHQKCWYGRNIYMYSWCMSSMRRSIFRHSSRSFQGTGFCRQRFGVDFDFPKNGMWFTTGGILGIPEECQLHQ